MKNHKASPLQSWIEILLAIALGSGLLTYGGSSELGQAAIFGALSIAWLAWLAGMTWRRDLASELGIAPGGMPLLAGVLCLVFGGYLILQTVPLPTGWVILLSPERWRLETEIGSALGRPPARWMTLSLDPESTRRAMPGAAMAMMAFLLGASLGVRRRLRVLVCMLVWLGAAQTAIGMLFEVVSETGGNKTSVQGTFYNRNHFAAWLIFTLPLAFAWALRRIERNAKMRNRECLVEGRLIEAFNCRQSLWLLLPAIMTLAIIESRSRTGFAMLLATPLALLPAWRLGRVSLTLTLASGVILGLALLAGVNSDYFKVLERFEQLDDSFIDMGRWRIWLDSLAMWCDFPWFGVGLGNYPALIKAYASTNTLHYPAQAHNEWIEALVTLGIIGCLPLAGLWGCQGWIICKRLRHSPVQRLEHWAASVSLLGLTAFSFTSSIFHIPLFLVAFFLLAGALTARPTSGSPEHQRQKLTNRGRHQLGGDEGRGRQSMPRIAPKRSSRLSSDFVNSVQHRPISSGA